MQTFLPYWSFIDSARCLDDKRLGKQRVETKQILWALLQGPTIPRNKFTNELFWNRVCPKLDGITPDISAEQFVSDNDDEFRLVKTPWYNHPATQMWKGYEFSLATYGHIMCTEWRNRRFDDNLQSMFESLMSQLNSNVRPGWITDEFIRSHRSNLIRKMPEYYGQMWPDVPDDLPYIWPTKVS